MNIDLGILWGPPGLLILHGLGVTLKLAAVALVFALAIGFVVGIVRWIGLRACEPVIWLYVEFARNTPPVVQLLFWYFSASFILPKPAFLALRDFGFEFSAAVIALSIYHGAFFAEVIRAGLNAVPKGQAEAARVLGLGMVQAITRIILPQAMRVALPPLVNEVTALIKNTSLAMAIGVTEMTFEYRDIDDFMFRGVEALIAVTCLYMLICLACVGLGSILTRHLSRSSRRKLEPVAVSGST